MASKTVEINDNYKIELVTPKSHTARYEVAASLEHGLRAGAAALAMCWQSGPSPRAPKASYAACKYDILKFGGEALDDLLTRGLPLDGITRAARAAVDLCVTDLVSEPEIDEIEGN